ncbi:MAG: hypothetical protein AMXMBFR61_05800 [Fimbriimonadales bacterium]
MDQPEPGTQWQMPGYSTALTPGGVRPNELPDTSKYRIAYALEDLMQGGLLKASLVVDGWAVPADPYRNRYFREDSAGIQDPPALTPEGLRYDRDWHLVVDVLYCDPETGRPFIVDTLALGLPLGEAGVEMPVSSGRVAVGEYEVRIYSRHHLVGRWECDNLTQTHYRGMGHGHVPLALPNVQIEACQDTDLGQITMANGDGDLDCEVGMADLSLVLQRFGATVLMDSGCPPSGWNSYYSSIDADYSGVIVVADLNVVLNNFAQTGPHRW